MRAVVALLAHSLSIAALYALLAAGLVAVGQILIYSGAIVVLFLFVVTLLPPGGFERLNDPGRLASAICVGLVLLVVLGTAFSGITGTHLLAVATPSTVGAVENVGHQLFDSDKLLVPFELTTMLLLVAIIGAVALWRRQGEDQAKSSTGGSV